MTYPQGINFRQSTGFVTDVSPADVETAPLSSHPSTYPHTTVQGNNVGWEESFATGGARDRDTGVDARLAGVHFSEIGSTPYNYRFDLPSAGDYNVRCAEGDFSNARTMLAIAMYDTTTSLGNIVNAGGTTAANEYFDASNTKRTAAAWPAGNVATTLTFATTICRFRFLTGIAVGITHLYVESAVVADNVYSMGQGVVLQAVNRGAYF